MKVKRRVHVDNRLGRINAYFRRLTDPIAMFTALIFLANAIYVGVASCSLRALYQSNEWANRAWVLPGQNLPESQQLPLVEGKPFNVALMMENVGRSPAQRIRFNGVAIVGPRNTDALPDDSALYATPLKTLPSSGILGPNHRASLPYEGITLSQKNIDDLTSGAAALYFFGRFIYSDQFSDSHRTRFCMYWVPGLRPGEVSVCPRGNEAD